MRESNRINRFTSRINREYKRERRYRHNKCVPISVRRSACHKNQALSNMLNKMCGAVEESLNSVTDTIADVMSFLTAIPETKETL